MMIGHILNLLKNAKPHSRDSWMAVCPAHKETKGSLSITRKDGKILLYCFGGCSQEDVVAALGITMADLFESAPAPATLRPTSGELAPAPEIPSKIVVEYDYLDEQCNVLYQVVRLDPKSFRQRHKNGKGEWVWDMTGVRRVLYHLETLAGCEEVYLVEGEKDTDNLIAAGAMATTSPGGANAWRDEYAQYLMGKVVTIIPDKDSPGMAYARQAANSLAGKAKEVRVVILPDLEGVKDVTDWLALGHTAPELIPFEQSVEILFASDKPAYRQIDELIQWDRKLGNLILTFRAEKVSQERTGIHSRVSILGQREMLSWSYLNVERREDRSSLATAAHSALKTEESYSKEDMRHDLDAFCAGLWEFHVSRFTPEELAGDETPKPLSFLLQPYIVESGGTIIYAPPGRGKSFTALFWAISVDAGCYRFWPVKQRRVLFINLERSRESLMRRLTVVNRVLGLPPTRPLLTLSARGRSLSEVLPACRKAVTRHNVGLVVLDSISRAGLGDLNENLSGNRIIDGLSSLCATWLALGHTSRSTEDHLFGSVMQDAGADVCVQLASELKEDGTLGLGWAITKQNDIGSWPQRVYALEFGEEGLRALRPAKPGEFVEVEGKAPQNMQQTVIDWITDRDSGDATATEIANEFGYNRSTVSRMLNAKTGKFQERRRVKQKVYYGVKTSVRI